MSRPLAFLLTAAAAVGALVVSGGSLPGGEVAVDGDRTGMRVAAAAPLAAPHRVVGGRPAARPTGVPVRASREPPLARRWLWPLVPRPTVLRRFRAPPGPYAAGHRGLDLAARTGDPVLAVADGRVSHSGSVAGRGTVTVVHASGLRSTYEPVTPSVATGEVVAAGETVGVVGVDGRAVPHCGERTCLHLGARAGEGYVDPWPLLAGGELALLPVD